MVNVSEATKNAFRSDAAHTEIEIVFPDDNITLRNEDLVSGSFNYKEILESSENLTFTGCNASSLEFECFDLIVDLTGKWVEAYITCDNTDRVPVFKGYVDKVTNMTHEQFSLQFTAYDAMKKINELDVTEWYNNLSFPTNIKALRDSFFNYCSNTIRVTQANDTLTNDFLVVDKTIENETIKGEDIIKPICQLNGSFGRINREGVFEYVHFETGRETIYPAEDLFPRNQLYPEVNNDSEVVHKSAYTTIKFENYRVSAISKIQLVDKDGAIAATAMAGSSNTQGINLDDTLYPKDTIYPAEDIYPSDGGNEFTISNNPFLWGRSSEELTQVANNLLNTIGNLWYIPMDLQAIGLPYVQCGDFITASARRSIVYSYVLERTLKGDQYLTDNYISRGDRKQPEYKQTLQDQIDATNDHLSDEVERSTKEDEIHAERIQANYIKCQEIEADVGNFKELTAENFRADRARIGTIEANYVTTAVLTATVANIERLIANEISAVNIRCDSLDAEYASLRTIVANKISTNELGSRIAELSYVTINGNLVYEHKYVGWRTKKIKMGDGSWLTIEYLGS